MNATRDPVPARHAALMATALGLAGVLAGCFGSTDPLLTDDEVPEGLHACTLAESFAGGAAVLLEGVEWNGSDIGSRGQMLAAEKTGSCIEAEYYLRVELTSFSDEATWQGVAAKKGDERLCRVDSTSFLWGEERVLTVTGRAATIGEDADIDEVVDRIHADMARVFSALKEKNPDWEDPCA